MYLFRLPWVVFRCVFFNVLAPSFMLLCMWVVCSGFWIEFGIYFCRLFVRSFVRYFFLSFFSLAFLYLYSY